MELMKAMTQPDYFTLDIFRLSMRTPTLVLTAAMPIVPNQKGSPAILLMLKDGLEP